MDKCIVCGAGLSHDEKALYKKLVNRGAKEYMCINCCAKHFEVSADLLREKAEQFKKLGCTLFTEQENE